MRSTASIMPLIEPPLALAHSKRRIPATWAAVRTRKICIPSIMLTNVSVTFLIVVIQSSMILCAADRGCEVPRLVSTGGPAPQKTHTLAIRWTGYSNFELAYGGQILLLDAYFDRGSTYPPLGFKAADVTRADAILIGHGHFDHMSDAASVGVRTGALVVGAPITTDKLRSQNLDAKQIRTVTGKGGELQKIGKFQIEPILGRHGEP